MRIVVLIKPVPDTTGQERLGPDLRVDRRTGPTVVNANDEYSLEAALKLVELHGGEVTLLSMAPPSAPETLRKALAMGATRGVLVTDEALAGSCIVTTMRVLAAALGRLEFDLVLAGADTSDGTAGVVPAGLAALCRLPYLSNAGGLDVRPADRVTIRRLRQDGYDVLEAPLPALVVATQALGAPRYPTLKGIMAARSKEIVTWSLADIGLAGTDVGGAHATTRVLSARPPAARNATRVVRAPAAAAAQAIVDFLVERRVI